MLKLSQVQQHLTKTKMPHKLLKYHEWRKEADQLCTHMNDQEKHEWALANVKQHESTRHPRYRLWFELALLLAVLVLARTSHCQTITPTVFNVKQLTNPWITSVTTWGGSTLGAMANYGTSPGIVLVPGVNAFITNIPAVTQSGTWTMQPGNTANTTPWLINVTQ